MALPFMKFYLKDWRADPRLRSVSLSARGLWLECLCLAHEADPYGHVLVAGRAPATSELAMLVGAPASEVRRLRSELIEAGVPDVTEDGVLVSRRMVRDAERRRRDADRQRAYRERDISVTAGVTSGVTVPVTEGVTKGVTAPVTEGVTRGVTSRERATAIMRPPHARGQITDPDPDPPSATFANAHSAEGESSLASTPRDVMDAWNQLTTPPIVHCRKLNAVRLKALKVRLKEHTPEDIEAAIRRIEVSPFCRGENDRGWCANIDFFLRPRTITKVLEGQFDPPEVERQVSAVLERYRVGYKALRNGATYTPTAAVERADQDAARRLCAAYSEQQIGELIDYFLAIPDERDAFLRNKTRTLTMLLSLAPKIAEKLWPTSPTESA